MKLLIGRVQSIPRRLSRALKAELHARSRRRPVRARTVLYESFAGNEALCNPEAIFRELLASPDLADLKHIWVLDNSTHKRAIEKEFGRDSRVRFVRYRSNAYFRAVATSGFLINNATFPPEFGKRAGQTYINTWHGTPLKLMGYDMPRGAFESANTLRNFLSADYLLSQNPFMTEQMYEKAYKLRGIYRGLVIEEGYPRIDRQTLHSSERKAARDRLESAGVTLGDREVVLYAPTWKGQSFSSPQDDAQDLVDAVSALQTMLGDDRYVVLLKTHQSVHKFAATNPEFRRVLVPNDIPTNIVLGLSSVLITDYSSIFFDFLATQRPIIFYTPDETVYTESRGTYFTPDELPGPVCHTLDEVSAAIAVADVGEGTGLARSTRYNSWVARFAARDDGSVSSRVVDIVFRGRRDDYNVLSMSDDSRQSMLLHLGGMRSNGITTSALNLLSAIDHDRFDVSVVFGRPRGKQERVNQSRIDPRVRQFLRTGGMNGSKFSHARRRLDDYRARATVHRESPSQTRMWEAEWIRCFGDSRFDIVADFSGYATFWATLLLHAPGAIRSIWLHNDMAAEEHRVIRGKRRMRRSLRAVFALYSEYDALVSVSPTLSEVNRKSLAGRYEIDSRHFVSARNLADEEHILAGLKTELTQLSDFPIDEETDERITPPWAEALAAEDKKSWFVSVGRFSHEKNQARLLRAFAIVHSRFRNARLILVGYGPLRDDLEKQLEGLQLAGSAYIVGPLRNPVPVMAAADCFVLSSNYEGQPMVILEAAMIGLPIVSVDFDSVRDALPTNDILVVSQSDDALAEGMLAFLRGEVAPSSLDAQGYNQHAIAEFVDAVSGLRTEKPAVVTRPEGQRISK